MQEKITQTLICIKCNNEKSISDFYKDKYQKYGVQTKCKECVKVYCAINKDHASEYRKANKEKIVKRMHDYYQKNKDYLYTKNKEYSRTDKGRLIKKNFDLMRRTTEKDSDVTTSQLLELQQNAKVCYWCNESLKNKQIHIDHYIPISKGGKHTISNLVVSCSSCNLRKNAKDPIVFANSIGKLL